ncbi:hypothetical protein LWC34_54830 [Kibdelosporangium philippinense]|uniref:Uncharacterized protein n=1 Tax=Kibdelosporangium philippinense TaxID=211113 RepID=A0ABS8ZWZ1_9PSEU|nr:hypothetical protein [Kibdelosporangium philippinense]MCE7011833.1 hypothetical protein [Kibdelosporangium philippinense]
MAEHVGVVLADIVADDATGLAGAMGVGFEDDGQLRALVGLAEDFDDGLRTDVLAFALALFTGEPQRLVKAPGGRLGIGRRRLTPTAGVGHLAFHLAYSCGRDTSSATFELIALPSV